MVEEAEIVRALVGQKHLYQYQTDAQFKVTIDTLARMLPFWIDGIAAHCAESTAVTAEQIEKLMHGPFKLVMPNDGGE